MPNTTAGRIQVADKQEGELTESQRKFNRLTEQLETMHISMGELRTKLDDLLKLYSKNVPVFEERMGKAQIAAAKILSQSVDCFQFSNSQIKDIATVVTIIFDQAFTYVEPDEETQAIYNMWSPQTYNDGVEAQAEEMKRRLKEKLQKQMGIDMDLSHLDLNSPDGVRQFQELLKAKIENPDAQTHKKGGAKRKTKKQMELEAQQEAAEKAQIRSLRGIYYSLAKVLHPDTATGSDELGRKEELMKRVTVAYSEKDLRTLLKLEMEWLHVENEQISRLSVEKQELYNAVLKNQIDNLKADLDSLPDDPCYHNIHRFIVHTPKKAKASIKSLTEDLKFYAHKYEAICRELHTKQSVLQFVRAMTS